MDLAIFKITKAERDKVPASDFGDPKGRRYPIRGQGDVDSAARLIGKVKGTEQEQIKSRIVAICKRKGLDPPESWESGKDDEKSEHAFFSAGLPEKYEDGDYMVYPDRYLFEDGDFPEVNYDMTPEELSVAEALFEPVPLDIQHRPTVIQDDKIGQVLSMRTGWENDKYVARADIAVQKWLDPFLKPETKISASWDRGSKTLHNVALCLNPRIPEASLNSAFAKFASKSAHHTNHGQRALQNVHDMAVSSGAVCVGEEGAKFASKHENKAIQEIHDKAVEHGASCDTGKPSGSYGAYFGEGEEDMDEKEKASAFDRFMAFFGGNTPDPKETEKPAEKGPTERETQLETQVRLYREREAADFAESLFRDKRISAAEKDQIKATYVQFAEDDERDPSKVAFGDQKKSRIEIFRERELARPQMQLQKEFVEGNDADGKQLSVLFAQDKDESTRVYDESKKWAERQNGAGGSKK